MYRTLQVTFFGRLYCKLVPADGNTIFLVNEIKLNKAIDVENQNVGPPMYVPHAPEQHWSMACRAFGA